MVCFVEIPVEFTEPLKPQEAEKGAEVTFECALSKPDVPVKWLKDGVEIAPSKKYEMIDDANKHILKLHDVSPEEAASFTVQAGPVDSSADLTVKG